MKKLNFYLTDDQYDRLHLHAAGLDISLAELLRRAIDAYVPMATPSAHGIETMTLPELTAFVKALEDKFDRLGQHPLSRAQEA